MNFQINDAGVIILAAGLSKRMDSPKPLLKFDNEKRFIDKIVYEYKEFGCKEIIIVINEIIRNEINLTDFIKEDESHLKDKIKIVINKNPEFGRFSSIKAGLKILNPKIINCFLQNIDNPFVNKDILSEIYESRFVGDCIIPTYENKGGHPILISKNIINNLIALEIDDLPLDNYLKSFKSKRIEIKDENILLNINTPEQYEKIFKNRI